MKKQLIPTISLVALGAAMLGTSTYAWFSANTTVTATGISLSAKSSASLLISNETGKNYGVTTALTDANASRGDYMDPCTRGYKGDGSASTTSVDFKKLTADDMKLIDGATGQAFTGKTLTYQATTNDFAKSQVYLYYVGNPTENIKASITLTYAGDSETELSDIDEIYKAMKVALYAKGTTTSLAEFSVGTLALTTGTYNFEYTTATADIKDIAITSGTELALDVYAWVEGTDENCKNATALNGQNFALTLNFEAPAI